MHFFFTFQFKNGVDGSVSCHRVIVSLSLVSALRNFSESFSDRVYFSITFQHVTLFVTYEW